MSEKQNDMTRTGADFRELAPVYDIPLTITVEVGRLRLRVRDLLRLSAGTVIELKKPSGEPLDICVNEQQVARGEVIASEHSAGVRIVEVPKPAGLQ
jgi:flagellar motor switch protein FliN/FliY